MVSGVDGLSVVLISGPCVSASCLCFKDDLVVVRKRIVGVAEAVSFELSPALVEARNEAFFLAGSVELKSVTLEATESPEGGGGNVFGSGGAGADESN